MPLACIVGNPAKAALTARVRDAISHNLRQWGYRSLWLPTSPHATGEIQARTAVASGASLVLSAGGDGTTRSVAAGLAHTGVELGIIPVGTANLAARAYRLPVTSRPSRRSREAAVISSLQSLAQWEAQPTDMAWVDTSRPDPAAPPSRRREACLVVTGIGFDARLVAQTNPRLKHHAGWLAYAASAMTALRSEHFVAQARYDGRAPEDHRARCFLIANGGTLPAGITLLPDAQLDDATLDVAAIDPVAGVLGWASLARQVLPPWPAHYGDAQATGWRRPTGRVIRRHGQHIDITLSSPQPVEVDGDLLPPTRRVCVDVDPGALLVRRPGSLGDD